MKMYGLERVGRIVVELYQLLLGEDPAGGAKVKWPVTELRQLETEEKPEEALKRTDWVDYTTGNLWGGKDKHTYFRVRVTTPKEATGKPLMFRIATGYEGEWDALNPQFLIYVNGQPKQGLDTNHQELLLSSCAGAGESFDVLLWGYSGLHERRSNLFCWLVAVDAGLEALYYNLRTPAEVAALLDEEDRDRIRIVKHLNAAVNLLDLRDPASEAFHASVDAANQYLDEEFYGKACDAGKLPLVTAVGHTHIDVAWQWRLCQTREKTARTFSTMLELMEEYPDFVFMSSQPQLYQYLKEDHPELYERVKARVEQGRWEAEGAMWLEADCNITSGESLVRQVLFGTRFFRDEFGVENHILWLPDVFGYSAALPQILRRSGIDYFMTTKINWNQYNKLPADTFRWRGIDGTEILTHFIPAVDLGAAKAGKTMTTYNGDLNPSQVMGAWHRYQQKNLNENVLFSYGYGDGGGGPTRKMVEMGRRMAKGIPGCPRVEFDDSRSYFKRLAAEIAGKRELPLWSGELYLEYHRGTYTSQAQIKRHNRKSEFLYEDAEFLSSLAKGLVGSAYPQKELNEGWRTLLLNQFHDILPGSSIHEVYEDCEIDFARIRSIGEHAVADAMEALRAGLAAKRDSVVVYNALSFNRSDVAEMLLGEEWMGASVIDEDGEVLASQWVEEDGVKKLLFMANDVPAKGYRRFGLKRGHCKLAQPAGADPRLIENDCYRIELDDTGAITSLWDKYAERQVLKPGERGNVLQAFEDKPMAHDVWDIDVYYQEKMWIVDDVQSMEIVEDGEVRTVLRVIRKFSRSLIAQDMIVYKEIPRIDFRTWVDWKEKQVLLKVAFPVDIHAEEATYEVQYGNVKRPTHWNTSWDLARFEVCAHKWADVSEGGYGVSLLNDCKFGYDIRDSVMRLSLLKSGIMPDPHADEREHSFTYALYPHMEDWKLGGTVDAAYSLNVPLRADFVPAMHEEGTLPGAFSLVELDEEADNVIAEVVKEAEDGEDVVIRLYEFQNRRGPVQLAFHLPFSEVWDCDLMEREETRLESEDGVVEFEIRPYQIRTLKFKR